MHHYYVLNKEGRVLFVQEASNSKEAFELAKATGNPIVDRVELSKLYGLDGLQHFMLVLMLFWGGFSIYGVCIGKGWIIAMIFPIVWGPLLLFFFGQFESVAQSILPDSKETYAAFDKGGSELFKFRAFTWSGLALVHAKERDPRVSHISKVVLDA